MYNPTFNTTPAFLQKVLVQSNPLAVLDTIWDRLSMARKAQVESVQELDILETQYRESFIKSLKTILADLYLYQGEIDGSMTPCLRKSLRRVQRYYGMPATGRLDPETWQAVVLLTR
ncbi:MAG: peptidoglycan-binding domain-containing protein [Prochlorothrix sp.]